MGGAVERLSAQQGRGRHAAGIPAVRIAVWINPPRRRTSHLGDRRIEASHPAAQAALRPAGPHWYLATVGTRPDRRSEGLASIVIRAGLAACDEAGLPAAVETSNEANCRLYERLGFQAAGDRTAPDGGLRVWVLVRPAQR
jgi:ribosomal protein S18 acetylase RimI-like enzyme